MYELPFTEACEYAELIVKERDADERFRAALHGVDFKASGSSNASGTLRNSHTRMATRLKQQQWGGVR